MRIVLIAVVVAIAAEVVVGGVGSALAAARAESPCKLVTASDAKKALGVTVAAGKLQTVGLYQACRYANGVRSLSVLERQLSRSSFDQSAKRNPGPVVHITGVGSDAYSAGGGTTLLLWKNGTELTLLATGVSSPLKVEETVGKIAANRL